MMSDERVLAVLRDSLNKDEIKLWLAPFTDPSKSHGIYSEDFLSKYAAALKLGRSQVENYLEQLRMNALHKLDSNKKFKETGVATLKIKMAKNKMVQNAQPQMLFIQTKLDENGQHLRNIILEKFNLQNNFFKLISSGLLIQDHLSLQSQKIRNNSVIMCIQLDQTQNNDENYHHMVHDTIADASLLLGDKEDSRLQITDQHGKTIDIPKEERNALAIAMALNQKAQSFMKLKDYANALTFLLEADRHFSECTSQLLDVVDNYALVCLDIVWCYLCLRSINHLPDAERRLKISEKCLKKSYGQNFERLLMIKGSSGHEAGLFARLHLLQGVLAFCQNHLDQAKNYLLQSKMEINRLKVDDDKLSEVVALGHDVKDARLALRHSNGDLLLALSYIQNKQMEKKERRKKDKEARKKKLKCKLLGKTDNGQSVDADLYQSLVDMGFASNLAKLALQRTNNHIQLALQLIDEDPSLAIAASSCSIDQSEDSKVSKVKKLGYDHDTAVAALQGCSMDVDQAIDLLVDNSGTVPHSSHSDSVQKELEAAKRLAPDMAHDEDHLDFTFEQETMLLNEYLDLLNNLYA